MIIKEVDKGGSFLGQAREFLQKFFGGLYRTVIIALLVFVVFLCGILVQRSGFLGDVVKPVLTNKMFLINLVKGQLSDPERMTIDISYTNYQKLAHNREIALQRGLLLPENRDEVSAYVRYGDKSTRVDLRLKGDLRDHWEDKYKWSFRIKTKGDNTIMGMKQFSVQRPMTRGFLNEWILHRLLKHEDFIALRYDFIELVVNGKNLGVYAMEEHFEKRLVENNQRREGPIIKFDDYLRWAGDFREGSEGYNESFYTAPIDAFQTNKVKTIEEYGDQFMVAKNLLEAFRRQELPVRKVFDITKLARLFAIIDLFGHHHAMYYANIRFYYNPVTSFLEPIGYDNQGLTYVSLELLEGEDVKRSNWKNNVWISLFFRDYDFYKEYIDELQRISQRDYLDKFFSEVQGELNDKLSIIYKTYPTYVFEGRDILYSNQAYMRKMLHPDIGIQAYFIGFNSNELTLEIANNHTFPMEILGVSLKGNPDFMPSEEIIIPPKKVLDPVEFKRFEFKSERAIQWADSLIDSLSVAYRVLGTEDTLDVPVYAWSYYQDDFVESDFIRRKPNFEKFRFLKIDNKQKTITLIPGKWELSESLIIPAGYDVICGGGASIDLSNSAVILSYSPLLFRAPDDDPIKVVSSDSTGQGMVVLNAVKTSILENVIFDNLSNPAEKGWALTGAVTFYESPVEIRKCEFTGNRSEDGLNIIRADFVLDRTLFSNTYSDAFDGDFCNGVIKNSAFMKCGNDAFDVSGSVLEFDGVKINGAGDKGVSIGENSSATGRDIEVRNAEIAFASKDLSKLDISGAVVDSVRIAFTVYQKKPEFGEATITAENIISGKTEVPYLVEDGSRLTIDGEEIFSNQEKVKDLLYGVKYGKSSQ